MASDPTAGGAPADMPVDPDDLDIPPRPETAAEWQRLVEQLQAEKADLQDRQLRALAEAQNVRRRAQQDVEKERKFGVERFARDVLSVADNFGRALSALPADTSSIDPALRNVIVGIQATDRELQSVLERHGVTRIESLGKPFNAEFHQATFLCILADPILWLSLDAGHATVSSLDFAALHHHIRASPLLRGPIKVSRDRATRPIFL